MNGVNVPPTNVDSVNADGSYEYKLPGSEDFVPNLDGLEFSGKSWYNPSLQMLHFIAGGGDIIDMKTGSTIILNMEVTTELTTSQFYDSDNFPYYLAAHLGVPESSIVFVNVIAENSRRKRRNTEQVLTVSYEIGAPAASTDDYYADSQFDNFSNQSCSDVYCTWLVSNSTENTDVGGMLFEMVQSGDLGSIMMSSNNVTSVSENIELNVVSPDAELPDDYTVVFLKRDFM